MLINLQQPHKLRLEAGNDTDARITAACMHAHLAATPYSQMTVYLTYGLHMHRHVWCAGRNALTPVSTSRSSSASTGLSSSSRLCSDWGLRSSSSRCSAVCTLRAASQPAQPAKCNSQISTVESWRKETPRGALGTWSTRLWQNMVQLQESRICHPIACIISTPAVLHRTHPSSLSSLQASEAFSPTTVLSHSLRSPSRSTSFQVTESQTRLLRLLGVGCRACSSMHACGTKGHRLSATWRMQIRDSAEAASIPLQLHKHAFLAMASLLSQARCHLSPKNAYIPVVVLGHCPSA